MTPQAAVPAIAQTQADPSGVIAVAPQRAPDWYDPHKARCPWGLGAGFVVYVLLPLAATAWYLWSEAADQYAATTGFSVRAEDVGSAIELLGGVADLSGSSARSDADLLVAFIASQDMVRTLDARLDLRARWSLPDNDPIFAFDPSGTIEDLTDYWQRMVRVTHDPGAGLIEVEARAFAPDDAQMIVAAVFEESSARINALSAIARTDTTRHAKRDLAEAEARLALACTELTAYRSANQVVNPGTDVQGQMGVLATLQQQLADEVIRLDMLKSLRRPNRTRVEQAEQRVRVIESRVADERSKIGGGEAETSAEGYATVVAGFERLQVEREIAETAYGAAQVAYDVAVAEARRQTRYLAAYSSPTVAERATYPDRPMLLGLTVFIALFLWAVGAMVLQSLRDRR